MGVGYRNSEGYADPVPYQAISNMDKEQKRYMPMVYICSAYSGDVEGNTELAMFMDIAILSKCRELWVFGKPTAGMLNEIAYAERKQMTIKYFNEECKEDD